MQTTGAPDPRIQGWGEGLRSIINAQPPRTDYNFAHIIRENMPTVSHEIGQWCVYPNLKEIDKYTGILKAKNFEIFRETLKDYHMADLADAFLYASGRLQTLCYKADIEAALRTPGFAGFQLLDLHDFPGQGTALVGVLDPFWDEKGYVTGKEYSTFCNNTVPLIRFPKMVWLNNETLNVPIEIAHFGEKPLQAAHINWQISDRVGNELAQGSFTKDLPLTNCIPAGEIKYALSGVGEPSQLIVSVEVKETNSKNQWNIWVYPAKQEAVEQLPYITSTLDNQTMVRLDKGRKCAAPVNSWKYPAGKRRRYPCRFLFHLLEYRLDKQTTSPHIGISATGTSGTGSLPYRRIQRLSMVGPGKQLQCNGTG